MPVMGRRGCLEQEEPGGVTRQPGPDSGRRHVWVYGSTLHWMVYVYISVHLTTYVGYGRSKLPRKRITEVSPPYSFTGECPRHFYEYS